MSEIENALSEAAEELGIFDLNSRTLTNFPSYLPPVTSEDAGRVVDFIKSECLTDQLRTIFACYPHVLSVEFSLPRNGGNVFPDLRLEAFRVDGFILGYINYSGLEDVYNVASFKVR